MCVVGVLLVVWLLDGGWSQTPDLPALDVHAAQPAERFIRPSDGLELRLSRPLAPSDGQLAVMIADVDWTGLFHLGDTTFSYHGGTVRLPSGESTVAVYLVSGSNTWRQIATLTIHVTTPAGFEQVRLAPTADVNNAGQVAEDHQPDSNAPPRSTFQDFTSHLGFSSEHVRGGIHFRTQTNVLAVSNEKQALRFAQLGTDAARLDLSDYVWGLDARHVSVSLGTATFNAERHLVANFATRGITTTVRFHRLDFQAAVVNGQSIVGFANFFGVSTANNQVALAVVGAELDGQRPRAARVEVSFVDGSRLAQSGVTQGQVTDVLKTHGEGVRFLGSDPSQRMRLDTGFARSWSTNPADPLLSQGLPSVSVRPKTSDADYVDAAVDFVRTTPSPSKQPVTLTGSYRFERVDPLFASVGTPQGIRSDLLQHVAGFDANVGPVSGRLSQAWSYDNLRNVPSILRTDSDVTTASLNVPTGRLGQSATAALWWPVVAINFNRTSQIGEGTPANGGFVSPSQVPNQVNTLETVGADWNLAHWRFGYSMNHSFQDNRQPGRETSDFATLAQQLSVGLSPRPAVNVAVTFNRDRSTNLEVDQVSHTTRAGVILSWQIGGRSAISAAVNRTAVRDASAGPSDVADANLQYSYTFNFRTTRGPRLQAFGRWTWQSSNALDLLSGITNDRRNWTINTGLTMTLF